MKIKIFQYLVLLVVALSTCRQIGDTYEFLLADQVHKFKKLTAYEKALYQPYYDYDVSIVEYAENINLFTGTTFTAVTIGSRIFFRQSLNRYLLSHEMQHVGQYQKNPNLLTKYADQSSSIILKDITHLNVDVIHNDIGLEQDAIVKAQQVINNAGSMQLYGN
jgi:hypothetical protein